MTGNMRNKTSGEISFPPMNKTNWDGEDIKPLKEWLREGERIFQIFFLLFTLNLQSQNEIFLCKK